MSVKFFTLSRIVERVQELLEPALFKRFWVKAEISSGRERGGSFYCDLVETDEQGKILAQMRCTIWVADLYKIKARFKAAGLELKLENGSLVGMECKLHYHPVYGLSLNALDIDPSFALGELELKKRKIIETLRAEGLLELNAGLPLDLLPGRIGLITSQGSAAYNDFVKTLLDSPFAFRVLVADSAMQGVETEASVLYALQILEKLQPDLIVIARGGGSKIDLSWLDNEAIARRVAACSVPVWSGIGHEIDFGVLDLVAARHFKTPTAVAEELVARYQAVQQQADEARNQLKTAWAFRSGAERDRLRDNSDGLRQGARKLLQLAHSEHQRRIGQLGSGVRDKLYRHKTALRDKGGALQGAMNLRLRGERQALANLQKEMPRSAGRALQALAQSLRQRRERLQPARILARIEVERGRLKLWEATIKASSPEENLRRGYAMVYDAAGRHMRSAKALKPGMKLSTRMSDGVVDSVVEVVEEKT